jgi:hypothetical protein
VLQDTFFGVGQTVVVGVKDVRNPPDVGVIFGLGYPWKINQPVEIGADDAHLGCGGWHGCQPAKLTFGLGSYLVGHFNTFQPLA